MEGGTTARLESTNLTGVSEGNSCLFFFNSNSNLDCYPYQQWNVFNDSAYYSFIQQVQQVPIELQLF